jgi:hypothetical protein
MRRIVLVAAALSLAGCMARAPQPEPVKSPPVVETPQVRSNLIGMSAGDLIQRIGQPALQVREGPGLKLQFRGRSCILDAYLYPPTEGTGAERVTHVDTRLENGNDTSQPACIASLTRS